VGPAPERGALQLPAAAHHVWRHGGVILLRTPHLVQVGARLGDERWRGEPGVGRPLEGSHKGTMGGEDDGRGGAAAPAARGPHSAAARPPSFPAPRPCCQVPLPGRRHERERPSAVWGGAMLGRHSWDAVMGPTTLPHGAWGFLLPASRPLSNRLPPAAPPQGLFAKLSMTELRARQGVCSGTCNTYHCYKVLSGQRNGDGEGMGWGLLRACLRALLVCCKRLGSSCLPLRARPERSTIPAPPPPLSGARAAPRRARASRQTAARCTPTRRS
jgi:hypothetical protein